jgi:uracil-DNA glycosylase
VTSPAEEGSPDAPICILGEAPAKVEMAWGRPLVGPSGDVFNDCMHAAGLSRRQCYILNIWPWPVVRTKEGDLVRGSFKLWDHTRGITPDGEDAAKDQLEKLRSFRGNVICSLGAPGLSLLAGKVRPIMKWRGSPLWSDAFGKKYIPTVHPAATIHGVYVWRYLIQSDLAKLHFETDSPELRLPERELLIAPTLSDVYHFMHECREARRFATDLEVINHQVSCFSLATLPNRAMTVPFVSSAGQPYWSEEDELTIWKWYASLMGDPSIMKINQNIVGFDAPFLLDKNHIHTRGPIGDTMIAQHIIYPHFPKGLDFIASWHTREPYWKDEGKVWKPNHKIDWPTFQRYCGKDSAVALEAWEILEKELDDGGFRFTYDDTLAMRDCLSYMSIRGLKANKANLEETKVKLEGIIEEKQAQLNALTGDFGPLNPASPKACKEYFYEYLGLPAYVNQTGGVSTNDIAMSRIFRKSGKGSKEAKLVQEIRAIRKLKGTYVDVKLDPDDRIRCSWNPRGTWTGRLSSSKTIFDTGLGLQNLHPEFKGFIVGG